MKNKFRIYFPKNLTWYIILVIILVIPDYSLFADVVETIDGMVLNGKIIEKNDKEVILKNAYGTFRIKLPQMQDMHRTHDYKEDIKVFKKKGKTISEKEAKKNYQIGAKELEKRGKVVNFDKIKRGTQEPVFNSASIIVSISPNFFWNDYPGWWNVCNRFW